MSEEPKVNLESIQEKARELYERKNSPEKEKPQELTETEQAVKEEIIKATENPQPKDYHDELSQAVSDLLSLDDREQLSELVKLAYSKHVRFALGVAKGLGNPLVLDTLHDLLARDELYQKLITDNKL